MLKFEFYVYFFFIVLNILLKFEKDPFIPSKESSKNGQGSKGIT